MGNFALKFHGQPADKRIMSDTKTTTRIDSRDLKTLVVPRSAKRVCAAFRCSNGREALVIETAGTFPYEVQLTGDYPKFAMSWGRAQALAERLILNG